ncbi:MAG: SDR family oxidoreductase [Proteobacteria bacterium]|nr:SDR family oxidoreductase [Pseudomonadota bacterium]
MLFCFGYGYVAQFIGDRGTSRSSQGKGKFLYKGGSLSKDICEAVERANFALISIPPQEDGDLLIPFIKDAFSSFSHLKWIGYLSSTSVYGNHHGAWVDENALTHPTSRQGTSRLKAEKQWLELDLPIHIFRLAGIYGPGRNILHDLKAGRAQRIFKKGTVFSRIHVADIVQALKASMNNPNPGRIYNIADNLPAPAHEVLAYGAELLGVEPPPLIPYEEAILSPLGHSFYQDSKRVNNKRLLDELIPSLLFPSYKEGLRNLLEKDSLENII